MPSYDVPAKLPQDVAAIHKLLAEIRRPMVSPSPESEERWTAFIEEARHLRPHLDRLLANVTPTPTPSNSPASSRSSSPEPEPLTSSQRRMLAVLKRAQVILPLFDSNPVEPDDILVIITEVTEGSRRKIEDIALGNLCRGYADTCRNHWRDILQSLIGPHPALLDIQLDSIDLDDVSTVAGRLIHRHEYLAEIQAAHHGHSWLLHVLTHIEALKFALDWNSLRGRGSQTAKSDFYWTLFKSLDHVQAAARLLSPDVNHHDHIVRTYASEYKAWKRDTIEPIVTGRNRYLTLYNAFGAAVLIDPVWNITDLGSHCSHHFPYLLEYIVKNVPETDDDSATTLAQLHAAASEVLLSILNVIGGNEIRRHVNRFMGNCPPTAADL